MSLLVPREFKETAIEIRRTAQQTTETLATYRELGQDIGGRIIRILDAVERGVQAFMAAGRDEPRP